MDEVRGLLARGYSPNLPALSSLGYRELVWHLQGGLALPQAVQQIKFATHRFARRQYAWFRPSDSRIHWYNIPVKAKDIVDSLKGVAQRKGNPGGSCCPCPCGEQ